MDCCNEMKVKPTDTVMAKLKRKENSMNYGFKMECPSCKSEDMGGAGGSFGGRVNFGKRKCGNCGLVIMILPMQKGFEYGISAKTAEEVEQSHEDYKRAKELQVEIDDRYNELSKLKRKL